MFCIKKLIWRDNHNIRNSKYWDAYLLSSIFIVLKTKSLNFLRSRLKATSTLGIFLVTPYISTTVCPLVNFPLVSISTCNNFVSSIVLSIT